MQTFDPNKPVEIREAFGIELRVLGFQDGHPVIYGPDQDRLMEYLECRYNCHVCMDAGVVHTHGGEKDPDPWVRKQDLEPCPCCKAKHAQSPTKEE
jgi:hypothetical protein